MKLNMFKVSKKEITLAVKRLKDHNQQQIKNRFGFKNEISN